jgi:hypothetical protein
MFCSPGLIFDDTEGVKSSFQVLRSRTRVRRYILVVRRALRPIFIFCAPGHIFGGTEGVGSRFHLLRSLNLFRRYRGRRVLFSCFARPDSFSMVPRASDPVFISSTERGRRFMISYFARPNSFSAVPRVSDLVFMFCAPGLNFGGTEGVGSRFLILRSLTRFRWYGGCRVLFSCFTREGIGSRFHVLRSRARFRGYGGRRVSISYFALPDSFSAVPRASGAVIIFCAP